MAGKYEIKVTPKGFHRFDLKAGNGEVIATSENYSSIEACNKGIESVRKIAATAGIEDQTVANFEKVSHPKFEVYTDKAGEIRFRLKARNGEIVISSEGYRSKASCMKGIASVRRNAPESRVVKID